MLLYLWYCWGSDSNVGKPDEGTVASVLFCYQVLKKIAKFIQEQNEKIYAPQGLLLTDPIERGLRVVSFVVSYICLLVCPPMTCYLFISVWHPLVMLDLWYSRICDKFCYSSLCTVLLSDFSTFRFVALKDNENAVLESILWEFLENAVCIKRVLQILRCFFYFSDL